MKRTVVITGASSGIGAACAKAFAKKGFQLILGARRLEKLEELKREIEEETGSSPFIHILDVTSLKSSQEFVQSALKTFGRVDILINNAGLAKGKKLFVHETESEDDWRQMIDTNVMGLLRMTRLLLPQMIKQKAGHILNIGSNAGRNPYAGDAVYCATKSAVITLTEVLRHELLGHPIRVTTIDPGMVHTEFNLVRLNGDHEKADSIYEGMQPLTAEDVAD
jgi:NADP-dependent 3-hydroxy acid dehydrogenase YdfG